MLKLSSLRTRFILAYVGLIILGFSGLAALAGRQLSNAARQDYELQTVNEVVLAARGIERPLMSFYEGDLTATELDEVLSTYEVQTNAELRLFVIEISMQPNRPGPNNPPYYNNFPPNMSGYQNALPDEYDDYPELQAAAQNKYVVVERKNEQGTLTIFTAAAITTRRGETLGYIQLSEPASNLRGQINERWAVLGIGVGVITVLSLFASIYLSVSLISPLKTLQKSALELSRGNLSYRAPNMGADELNEVAQAFNTMANQLEAMIEEQRAFASNTSHELRTPLTTMRLRTEALRYDTALDETTRTVYLQELDDELLRMSSLIDDLILLSRLDAGRAQKGADLIDFVRFAENQHRAFAIEAAEKRLRFDLILPTPSENPLTIQASLNHVSILFRNLLENALKYTPPDGKITWQVCEEGDQIISRIQDSGQGIEPENLPHVFDRFFRGDRAHSRDIQGTGLGLSLVRAIAEVYGAQIQVESAGKDRGTLVTIQWKKA